MPETAATVVEGLCEGLGFTPPPDVVAFAHATGTEVVFGEGAVDRIGEFCRSVSGAAVLVVTDPGIVKAGHLDRVRGRLLEAGFTVTVYDDVHENPTTDDVAACVEVARHAGVDTIVGLGGGSSMDTAKGCNFILTNGGEMRDYRGVDRAAKPMLPFIAVPTTAGTGSECQSFALIADAKTHQKMACGDKRSAARFAVLDPGLTLTQPPVVAAHTGIDAIAHAVETAVTKKRTPVSRQYSRLAFALLERSFESVLRDPDNLRARSEMQLGAAYAGAAIENSMLGAAHSAANPLTAHFDVIHGEAVGVMLPGVVRFNRQDPASAAGYRDLFDGDLASRIEELLEIAEMRKPLSSYGVDEPDIGILAAEAAGQWTAQFNPVEVDADAFARLFRVVL